ncbi:hypothetical protein [Klebsiella oxytoca]|uniref:hypothetical protein n=1 Tax=Klebsiella oxytoca TaxID=571 RepID=UPI0039C8FA12
MFWCGISLSVIYFVLLSVTINKLNLGLMESWNEFGDFLAGAFSPVAFLWLILGYLQQQKELQQNTRALELQAEELKNSVDQYKEMVLVAREQLTAERDNLETSRFEKESQYKPIIKPPKLVPYMIMGGKKFKYRGSLQIGGEDALDFSIKTEPSFKPYDGYNAHPVKSGELLLGESQEVVEDDLPKIIIMTIIYKSKLGKMYKDCYTYKLNERGEYAIIDDVHL